MTTVLAYIDPGSGSILAQLLFGGAAGLIAFAKLRWGSIKGLFRRGNPGANERED